MLEGNNRTGIDRWVDKQGDRMMNRGRGVALLLSHPPRNPMLQKKKLLHTSKNIEILCERSTWLSDGTFKTPSNIFTQIFPIIGVRKRTGHVEVVAIPIVYS